MVALDDLAFVHVHHLIGHVFDHGEVVRNEDVAHVVLVLQVLQQIQDLRLDRDIEGRYRLVADEHVRLHGEAAGNRDPLSLAAGEFVRILEKRNLGEPHLLEQFVDPVAALVFARPDAVHLQGLHEKLADRETRIERSIGILEDDLDPALVRHHLFLRNGQQVLAVEQGLAGRFPAQAQQRQRDRRLARTRFADYAQGFPPGEPERNVFDRLEFPFSEQSLARIEALAQVAHLENDLLVAAQPATAFLQTSPGERSGLQEIVYDRQPPGTPLKLRPAEQQRPRVGVPRSLEYLLDSPLFPDLAVAHHHHVVGDLADQGEIVRDEQHRHAQALLQRGDQLQDLLLDGHVERGRRLIGNQQLRLARDRYRDHRALLLAARELERIRIDLRPGLGDPDLAQELERAYPRLPARHAEMLGQDLGELEADREHGVQRAHRLLEDHRDIRAPQFLQFPGREGEKIAAAVQDLARRRHRRVLLGEQAQDRQSGHRLAAAGFPDQRDRAVHRYVEADALHRLGNGRPVETEIHLEVADYDQGFGAIHGGHLSLGSSASRRA